MPDSKVDAVRARHAVSAGAGRALTECQERPRLERRERACDVGVERHVRGARLVEHAAVQQAGPPRRPRDTGVAGQDGRAADKKRQQHISALWLQVWHYNTNT